MIHFQIPNTSLTLYKSLECIVDDTMTEPVISSSLSFYLSDIKTRIDHQEYEWDVYKRYTNPFEYIHTNVPTKRKSIAKYNPLSRSYFKMIEIVQFFHILDKYQSSITTFHLAEGPGGFIEALTHLRNNNEDRYIGMSILDDNNDVNIPAWKKSQHFLKENPNVSIELGIDKTGDILSIENFKYCCNKYRSSIDIITGDGGFDFSTDYNSQEICISKLLFGQVAYALCMQKYGGSFILKIFDSFMQHTLDILAILSSFYSQVYITKPQTSRFANSEKYIVCKGFLHTNTSDFEPYILNTFETMINSNNTYIRRFINIPVSLNFLLRIEEYNAIFGQQQLENIYHTLSLMQNKNKIEKTENMIKLNIQKCIHWCIKYKILHNTFIL